MIVTLCSLKYSLAEHCAEFDVYTKIFKLKIVVDRQQAYDYVDALNQVFEIKFLLFF